MLKAFQVGVVFAFLDIGLVRGFLARPTVAERNIWKRSESLSSKNLHYSQEETVDFHTELQQVGLSLCHGMLHASGVRKLSDIPSLTASQLDDMGVDTFDRQALLRVMASYQNNPKSTSNILSTSTNGAFDIGISQEQHGLEVVSKEHDIFRGRLFTNEQCMQMNRMAEYHAYEKVGTVGGGWTNELYTLTTLHMQCQQVPALIATTQPLFCQLRIQLQELFSGRVRHNSIAVESTGEPHLVKYHGKSKGTAMHIDNSKFVGITVNAMLSSSDDYSGGGTYIKAIDQTIHLKQGEMLIHLGDLEHCGVEIKSGVRRLLVCFFVCEWETHESRLDGATDQHT